MTVKENVELICDILEDILEGYDKEYFQTTDLNPCDYGISSARMENILEMLCESDYISEGGHYSAYEVKLTMKGFEYLVKYRGHKEECKTVEEVFEEIDEKLEEVNGGV